MEKSIQDSRFAGRRFDIVFILVIPVVALSAGFASAETPAIFAPVLLANLWFLGYHHVISTYTRIAFSRESIREHTFLVMYLPAIVMVAVALLAIGIGGWIIATIYLYWQWFHYTRQSYGISRFYQSKSGNIVQPYADINTYALYLLPLTGILYRSYQSPEMFLFMDVKTLPVSYELVMVFLVASVGAILLQFYSWLKRYLKQSLYLPYGFYMIAHHIIFAVGYMVIDDINYGWLVLNIWHNAQYIAFVWMQNNRKFKNGIDEKHKLISTISQDGKFLHYISVCLLITLCFYLLLREVVTVIQPYTMLPMVMTVYMAINFHHYIADSVIWRRKKRPIAIPGESV